MPTTDRSKSGQVKDLMSESVWPRLDMPGGPPGRPERIRERRSGPQPKRNIFVGVHFFTIPIAIYDTGAARALKSSHFKRYVTLCRLANWSSSEKISVTLQQLSELDGVAPRTARLAHIKLQELRMISVENTKPFTYRIVIQPDWWLPSQWGKPKLSRSLATTVTKTWD